MPQAGWKHAVAIDNHPQHINFGRSGSNQIYDFSGLHLSMPDTISYQSPDSTDPHVLSTASYRVTSKYGDTSYVRLDSASYKIIAQRAYRAHLDTLFLYSKPITLFRFPVAMGDSLLLYSSFSINAPGARFNPPYAYQIIRLRDNTRYTEVIDGSGWLLLPGCSYSCLRMKRTIYDTIFTEFKFSSTTYYNVGTTTSQRVEYYYLTKEAKGAALYFSYDSMGNAVAATWSQALPPQIPPYFTDSVILGGAVAFADTATVISPGSLHWDFGDGDTSGVPHTIHAYPANGDYRACLTVSGCHNSQTICDTVSITQLIPGVNYHPLALPDSVSLIVGHTLTVFPLLNDIDPDNDSMCLTSIWHSDTLNLVSFTCTGLTYTSQDPSFIGEDTVYYTVCDNDSTPLCDTSFIVFRIVPQLPVAIIGSPSGSTAFFCGRGFLRDSSLYYNPGLVIWHLYTRPYWCPNCYDSAVVYGDLGIKYYPHTLPNIQGSNVLYVCLTVFNNYGSSTTCDSFSVWCEGINDVDKLVSRLYPNPATDHLTIDLSDTEAETLKNISDIVFLDLSGRKIKSTPYFASGQNVPLSDIADGTYLIEIKCKDGRSSIIGKFNVLR